MTYKTQDIFNIDNLMSLVTSIHPYIHPYTIFPCGSDGKASACNAGDPGSIPGLGRSPERSPGSFLEKETATHSSTLAWRVPWMEAPGGLQSMGPQRVGRD